MNGIRSLSCRFAFNFLKFSYLLQFWLHAFTILLFWNLSSSLYGMNGTSYEVPHCDSFLTSLSDHSDSMSLTEEILEISQSLLIIDSVDVWFKSLNNNFGEVDLQTVSCVSFYLWEEYFITFNKNTLSLCWEPAVYRFFANGCNIQSNWSVKRSPLATGRCATDLLHTCCKRCQVK